jgi:hypothetical protein
LKRLEASIRSKGGLQSLTGWTAQVTLNSKGHIQSTYFVAPTGERYRGFAAVEKMMGLEPGKLALTSRSVIRHVLGVLVDRGSITVVMVTYLQS